MSSMSIAGSICRPHVCNTLSARSKCSPMACLKAPYCAITSVSFLASLLRQSWPPGAVRPGPLWRTRGSYPPCDAPDGRSEEHTSELQSRSDLVCRLLLEKKKKKDQHCFQFKKKKKKTRP